eukprot:9338957-Pyramimonas_sp.AAC.1
MRTPSAQERPEPKEEDRYPGCGRGTRPRPPGTPGGRGDRDNLALGPEADISNPWKTTVVPPKKRDPRTPDQEDQWDTIKGGEGYQRGRKQISTRTL